KLLSEYVDRIIYCDIDDRCAGAFFQHSFEERPAAEFRAGDVNLVISSLPEISVLFYRRDSAGGEGGSGVFVLGDAFMRTFVRCLDTTGSLIITDGSNERGALFRKMTRRSGLRRYGWNFSPTNDQPHEELNLKVIRAVKEAV